MFAGLQPETSHFCMLTTCAPDFFFPLPLHLLHLVAFEEQSIDYYSIFIIISQGAETEIFGASDLETCTGIFFSCPDDRDVVGGGKTGWSCHG